LHQPAEEWIRPEQNEFEVSGQLPPDRCDDGNASGIEEGHRGEVDHDSFRIMSQDLGKQSCEPRGGGEIHFTSDYDHRFLVTDTMGLR
jgi:hypothetical protein